MTSAPLQRARGCSAGTLLGAARTVSGAFAGPLARPLAPTRDSLRDSSLRARERITLRGHLIAISYRLPAFGDRTLASDQDGAGRTVHARQRQEEERCRTARSWPASTSSWPRSTGCAARD